MQRLIDDRGCLPSQCLKAGAIYVQWLAFPRCAQCGSITKRLIRVGSSLRRIRLAHSQSRRRSCWLCAASPIRGLRTSLRCLLAAVKSYPCPEGQAIMKLSERPTDLELYIARIYPSSCSPALASRRVVEGSRTVVPRT